MKNMSSVLHQSHILGSGVRALTILNGSLKHVGELSLVAQVVRSHPVHHAPVLHQIVLQRIPSQNHPSPRLDLFQGLKYD